MPATLYLIAVISAAVSAAPPVPPGYYAPAQMQHLNTYYIGPPRISPLLQPAARKARLETLDPDSEVELLPGADQPQQPPQQTPVAPNIPGLIPGQRVYIVHMPVPGIRPGTVGGYQPVYIVAAAPQGNSAYPGYQNPVLLDASGQVLAQVPTYQRPVYQGNPNILLGASPLQRPFDFAYQSHGYQPVPAVGPPMGLNQFIAFPGQPQALAPQPSGPQSNLAPKLGQTRDETKEDYDPQTNAQASPQQRPKL
ncbi:unnamed protein product [Leptosia nina]|uniref:Uncharacterized protein n=1 Tax=Leptosia nina TaxID=320188 RepID=A0AAV1JVR3_9NEOP